MVGCSQLGKSEFVSYFKIVSLSANREAMMSTIAKIFQFQHYHLLGNIALITITHLIISALFTLTPLENLVRNITFIIHLAHVIFIWIGWRFELHLKLLTRIFKRQALPIFSLIYQLMVLARLISILWLSILTMSSVQFAPMFHLISVLVTLGVIFVAFYSIVKYFGIERSAGGDHFHEKFRYLEKRGLFRYFDNVMYVFGSLGFILPGLIFQSGPGLVCGWYHYLGIWLHYFCTEKPDMKIIYEAKQKV